MIRRDVILRLIERAGPMLKRIFALRQAQQRKQSAEAVRTACRELLDLDLGLVLAMPAEGLRRLLTIDEGSGVGRCMVAARLIREQAALLEGEGAGDQAAELLRRAETLVAWVAAQPGGKDYLEAFKGPEDDGTDQA